MKFQVLDKNLTSEAVGPASIDLPPGPDAQSSLAFPTFLECVGKALVLAIETAVGAEDLPLTPFDSASIPALHVNRYIMRLGRHFGCSRTCFVMALMFIDRVVARCPGSVAVSQRNVHRLYLASLMVAAKFWDDDYFPNAHYAKCGGVTLKEMNRLEHFLLRCLRYELYIEPETYSDYMRALVALHCGPRAPSMPLGHGFNPPIRTIDTPIRISVRDEATNSETVMA